MLADQTRLLGFIDWDIEARIEADPRDRFY
jgi:hypothetical protein